MKAQLNVGLGLLCCQSSSGPEVALLSRISPPTRRKSGEQLLINEGGVQCVPVVFARLRRKDDRIEIGERPRLNGVPVAGLDPARAMQRGPGLVAFVLEDPMDVRLFRPGDMASVDSD